MENRRVRRHENVLALMTIPDWLTQLLYRTHVQLYRTPGYVPEGLELRNFAKLSFRENTVIYLTLLHVTHSRCLWLTKKGNKVLHKCMSCMYIQSS